jgi:hypothetical protein
MFADLDRSRGAQFGCEAYEKADSSEDCTYAI